MSPSLPLRLLAPGQTAEIDQVLGRADDVHRLRELGLCRGVTVEMVQPGVPCIIRVGGAKLCLREGELLGVLVRPVALV